LNSLRLFAVKGGFNSLGVLFVVIIEIVCIIQLGAKVPGVYRPSAEEAL